MRENGICINTNRKVYHYSAYFHYKYLQNFNNANHYSSITLQESGRDTSGDDNGTIGGIIYTVAEAHDGVKLWWSSGNIAKGKAILYRMVV